MQIVADIMGVVEGGESGTALVVSDRVGHCEVFVKLLSERGVKVELLSGQVVPERRAEIVHAVQNGNLQVLVATLQLISEGFDCPGLSTLFLTTPITFEGRLLQVIGRVMRPAENKQPKVYDYVDESIAALRRSANIRQRVFSDM